MTPDSPESSAPTIGVRELRNQVAAVLRRANAGERIIITVDGLPSAAIGPITPSESGLTLADLVAAGMINAPRRIDRSPSAEPVALPVDIRVGAVLDDLRGR